MREPNQTRWTQILVYVVHMTQEMLVIQIKIQGGTKQRENPFTSHNSEGWCKPLNENHISTQTKYRVQHLILFGWYPNGSYGPLSPGNELKIILSDFHNFLIRWLFLSPFCRWGNWGWITLGSQSWNSNSGFILMLVPLATISSVY